MLASFARFLARFLRMKIKTCDEDVPGGHSDNFDGFDRDNNPDFEPDWEAEYGLSGDDDDF